MPAANTVPCPLGDMCPDGGRHRRGTKVISEHARRAFAANFPKPQADFPAPHQKSTSRVGVPGGKTISVADENRAYFENGMPGGVKIAYVNGDSFANIVTQELVSEGHNRSVAEKTAAAVAMSRDAEKLEELFGPKYATLADSYTEGDNPIDTHEELSEALWSDFDMRVEEISGRGEADHAGSVNVSALIDGERKVQTFDRTFAKDSEEAEARAAFTSALESHYLVAMENDSAIVWATDALVDGYDLELDSDDEIEEYKGLDDADQRDMVYDMVDACYERADERFSSFFTDQKAYLEALG